MPGEQVSGHYSEPIYSHYLARHCAEINGLKLWIDYNAPIDEFGSHPFYVGQGDGEKDWTLLNDFGDRLFY